jgi:Mrp family chromosome partitioning ATPase
MKSIIISADYEEDMEALSTGDNVRGDLLSHAPVRDEEMISLLRALQLTMPQKPHWTIGIISTLHGEGVSSIARGLARIVARTPNAKVLICDVAGDPRARPSTKPDRPSANSTALATRASLDHGAGRIEFTWLPGSQVAMGALGEPGGIHAIAADVDSVRNMLSSVSDSFELTILDLPPVSESIIGPAMSKALDGVVLVVEAERTRSAAVQATQRTIRMHGGNVLGVVLNKRRFHIPNFIYRRL